MTSDRNTGDHNTTTDASDRLQPEHGSSNIPVEEVGGCPDESDSTSVKHPEEVANRTIRVQPPEEIPNDVVPAVPDLQNVNEESLNLDVLGGTEPMKRISVEGSSLTPPQAVVGTQPLKPDDGYRFQQADSESDEDGERSPFISSTQSSLTDDNNL